jgi:hypothetical protein
MIRYLVFHSAMMYPATPGVSGQRDILTTMRSYMSTLARHVFAFNVDAMCPGE